MQLSYLIMAHAHPELLARLVSRLDAPNVSINIHIDRRSDIRHFKRALGEQGIKNVHWVPRVRSSWGTFGQVRASRSLLEYALASDPASERFVFISGQDYPLRSAEKIYDFFRQHRDVSYMTYEPLPWNVWDRAGGLDRLRHYHFRIGQSTYEYPNAHLPPSLNTRLVDFICSLILPGPRPLPENVKLYGGSNWWNLTREAAVSILRYVEQNPSYYPRFRYSFASDELFYQTALMNSDYDGTLEKEDLRCVFWDGRHNEHPAFLRPDDFDEIAQSGKLFARKVHPEYSKTLMDRIDRELLG